MTVPHWWCWPVGPDVKGEKPARKARTAKRNRIRIGARRAKWVPIASVGAIAQSHEGMAFG